MDFIKNFLSYLKWKNHQRKEKQFDQKYNINTSYGGQDYLSPLDSTSKNFAVNYEPIHLHVLQDMLSRLDQDLSTSTFIDLGSGKGRALFMAANHEFRKIIGVEFSHDLHKIAKDNLDSFLLKSKKINNFELHCMDATQFDFPKSNLVVFLYNPFFGEVMEAIIKKIETFIRTEPYKVQILYRNPQCADLFKNSELLTLKVDKPSYHIYEGITQK